MSHFEKQIVEKLNKVVEMGVYLNEEHKKFLISEFESLIRNEDREKEDALELKLYRQFAQSFLFGQMSRFQSPCDPAVQEVLKMTQEVVKRMDS